VRAALLVLLVLATVLAQVAIAPFFPLAGAVVDLPVVVLLLLAIFAGPGAVMVALPLLVLFLGFSTNAGYEWLVLAYLPILPCAAWIQRQPLIPQTPYALVLAMAVAAAVWTRLVFAGVALTSGASIDVSGLVADILAPGAAFDAVVLSVAYFLCRQVRLPTRSLDLDRAEF
jgi:hypothetical protein